jgi:hypothetical protein
VKAVQGATTPPGLTPGPEPVLPDDLHPPSARLVIHAGNGFEAAARRPPLQRLAGWLIGRRRGRQGLPLQLTVQELEGRRVATFEPAGSLTQLRLPPGTYVVMASNGSERRSYTLTLGAGTSFEVYVDPLQPWRFFPSTPS